jgi:hypothetical protein
MSTGPAVSPISHVAICVRDMDRTIHFHRNNGGHQGDKLFGLPSEFFPVCTCLPDPRVCCLWAR